MRLYLAVAVLMLAFVAYTEAQDATLEEKLSKFGQDVASMGQTALEKAKATFDEVHNSEFAVSTRNWFQEQMNKIQTKLGEIGQ